MDSSKKILFLSFIPFAIIAVFVLYIVMPVYKDLGLQKEILASKKEQMENARIKLQKAEQDQKLIDEINAMEEKLGAFDINVPSRKELEVLLVDLEKFAVGSDVKILGLNANAEKSLAVDDPEAVKDKKKGAKISNSSSAPDKSKKSKKKKKNLIDENQPIILEEVPVEIKVLGYYPKIVEFIKKLENYERIITVDAIGAKDYNKDDEAKNPRIELQINARIFVLKERELKKEQEENS